MVVSPLPTPARYFLLHHPLNSVTFLLCFYRKRSKQAQETHSHLKFKCNHLCTVFSCESVPVPTYCKKKFL